MTLSDNINIISTALSNIRTAIVNKGVTPSGNITTYATAIGNISSGGGGLPIRTVDANGKIQVPTTFTLPSGVTDVGNNGLSLMFVGTSITSADLSSLTSVSGNYAFGLRDDDAYVYGGCFQDSSLSSIDLSNLATITGNDAFHCAFYKTNLQSVSFPSLTSVTGNTVFLNTFCNCPYLTSVSFPSLTSVTGSYAFEEIVAECSNVHIYFNAFTSSSFSNENAMMSAIGMMLDLATDCTVHMPSNLQSIMGSWNIITTGFGGTNTTVLFDLSATT